MKFIDNDYNLIIERFFDRYKYYEIDNNISNKIIEKLKEKLKILNIKIKVIDNKILIKTSNKNFKKYYNLEVYYYKLTKNFPSSFDIIRIKLHHVCIEFKNDIISINKSIYIAVKYNDNVEELIDDVSSIIAEFIETTLNIYAYPQINMYKNVLVNTFDYIVKKLKVEKSVMVTVI